VAGDTKRQVDTRLAARIGERRGAPRRTALYVERGRRPFCRRLCADGPAAHRKAAFFAEVFGDYKQFGWIRTASVGAIGLYESQ